MPTRQLVGSELAAASVIVVLLATIEVFTLSASQRGIVGDNGSNVGMMVH